jgi:hypothetical protein
MEHISEEHATTSKQVLSISQDLLWAIPSISALCGSGKKSKLKKDVSRLTSSMMKTCRLLKSTFFVWNGTLQTYR